MNLRIAKKIFATSFGVSVGLPDGGKMWVGESIRYRHYMLLRALYRLKKVKTSQRLKYLGHPVA